MPSGLLSATQRAALAARQLKLGAKRRFGWFEPLQIYPFSGYGTASEVHLGGRLIECDGVVERPHGGSPWQNLKDTVRRFRSEAIPCARMVARLGAREVEFHTDRGGYFQVALVPEQPLAPGWHPVELELLESVAGGSGLKATAEALVPPPDADFGVISDVDDTVIYSAITNRLRMIRLVMFKDAHTRVAFPGVAAFYRALMRGPSGRAANPIFYVSKSPWNLYDLLETFFHVHAVPHGPLFLRDLALLRAPSTALGLEQDKLSRIRKLLRLYPRLPFVLVGDSGQKDPEIYAQVVREHPGRVRAIYIRDVVERRRPVVQRIAAQLREHDVPMLLERETVQAALHALELGLVAPRAVEAVRGNKAEEETLPADEGASLLPA